jgi:hypothetical protein
MINHPGATRRRIALGEPDAEPGQTIVSFAIMLPVLLGLLALGVDMSALFAQRVQVQSAADLAALAAGTDLPDAAVVTQTARDFSGHNGFTHGSGGVTVAVTTPYTGDENKAEVLITQQAPTFFARFLGVGQVPLLGRAVAMREATGHYAVFAGRDECPDGGDPVLDWPGSSNNVNGSVHSNGNFKLGGSDNLSSSTNTYRCQLHASGSNPGFTATQTGVKPWPVTFTTAQFTCTFGSLTGPSIDLTSSASYWQTPYTVLKPGVYCSGDTISLAASNVTGNVTFIAQRIFVSGSNFNLTTRQNGVLFYSTDTTDSNTAIKVSGSGGSWTGIMYAPGGQADVSGSGNLSLNGSIVAGRVKISGSGFNLTGNGAPSAYRSRLVG